MMFSNIYISKFLKSKEGRNFWSDLFANDPSPLYPQKLINSEINYMIHHLDNWIKQSATINEVVYYMYNTMDTL